MPVGVYFRPAPSPRRSGGCIWQGAQRGSGEDRRPRAAADATAGLRRALAAQAGRFWAVGGRVCRQGKLRPSGLTISSIGWHVPGTAGLSGGHLGKIDR